MRLARALPALAGLVSCAAPPAPPRSVAAAPAVDPVFRYDVRLDARDVLSVDAIVFAKDGGDFSLERGAPFVSDLTVAASGPAAPIAAALDEDGEAVFRLPPCPPRGCRVHYRFALGEAAQEDHDVSTAVREAGALITSPGAWLIHPSACEPGQPFTLRVETPPGVIFTSGLAPADPTSAAIPPAEYRADVADLGNPAWAAFGPLHLARRTVEGEAIDVAFAPDPAVDEAAFLAWIEGSARLVHDYYGRPSIGRAQIVILPAAGRRGMTFGRTLGNGGATILAYAGDRSALSDLTSGWELIHELLHVSFPKLTRDHAWLEEGMATYVEPLIRARRGLIPEEDVFARFAARMPFGLPAAGDLGLDHTHTWGRTYWGGAIFCLLADVAIRERTSGRRSLDDALRAVLARGGSVAARWEIERVIAVGDEATGTTALRDLYAQQGDRPAPIDLAGLWQKLGVKVDGDRVTFDDGAPLAAIRRALTAADGRRGFPR